MNILMVAAENDAIHGAKVGGVGDVLRDIPPALCQLGHQVSVVLPDYGNPQLIRYKKKVAEFAVPFAGCMTPVTLHKLEGGQYDNYAEQLYVISHPSFYQAGGDVYCNNDQHGPFAQDASKFALFNAAICEALTLEFLAIPDALHLHDWHSACVSVLCQFEPRYRSLKDVHRVFTIHNLALQGIRPLAGHQSSLHAWFPNLNVEHNIVADPRYCDCFNPMRAGIHLNHKVHVVSPSYVEEIVKPSQPQQGFFGGEGLENDLLTIQAQGKLEGILNGCDYPEEIEVAPSKIPIYAQIQQAIASWMTKGPLLRSVDYLANERAKHWEKSDKPGIVMTGIGRLTDQKMLLVRQKLHGISALEHILEQLKAHSGRLIILGSGEPELEDFLTKVMGQYDNFLFINGYGGDLSESIYHYGDLFLMPSSFEPCGISQMLALRAGQPCLVHGVGGLKDTITHNENGFVFQGETLEEQVQNMLACTDVALNCYDLQPEAWATICNNAKQRRFYWSDSIQEYCHKLYQ